jgi:hypothetical protein
MLALSNASTANDIKSLVQKGDIEGGIVIPSNFTASVLNGEQGTLIIITDQSNPQISATIQAALSAVFNQMGTLLAQQNVQRLSPAVNASNSLAIVKLTISKRKELYLELPVTSISLRRESWL